MHAIANFRAVIEECIDLQSDGKSIWSFQEFGALGFVSCGYLRAANHVDVTEQSEFEAHQFGLQPSEHGPSSDHHFAI